MNFQSKKKPRYYYVVLERSIGPPKAVRSKEEELKMPYNLQKQNTLVLPCSTTSLNLVRREEMILQLQKKFTFKTEMDLYWVMKRPSSIKDKSKIGIFRFFRQFSKYRRKLKSGEDGRKSQSLTNTNINIAIRRREAVPKILSFSTDQIFLEEIRDFRLKTSFGHNKREKLMVEQKKELHNFKC